MKNIAIVGATGVVGETILKILQQRHFPIGHLYLLASEHSAGKKIAYQGEKITVSAVADFDFSLADIAMFSAGSRVSQQYVPLATAAGCVAIDNTSCFRYVPEVPLIVPEVNAQAIAGHSGIIANPNCSTIQMLVALKPIYDAVGIERINVATYQSVSGSGKEAIAELRQQNSDYLEGKPLQAEVYPQPIACNVLPHIDELQENGYTREEMKMIWETQKIFDDEEILVNPTAVRVPVYHGHSEAIHIETRDEISAAAVRELLQAAPGIEVIDVDAQGFHYPTPLVNAEGHDPVYVGRIRKDISHPRGINLWVTADNIRKGAALNTVQIAELLLPRS